MASQACLEGLCFDRLRLGRGLGAMDWGPARAARAVGAVMRSAAGMRVEFAAARGSRDGMLSVCR